MGHERLVLGAWVLSLIATLGSLRYSGIGFLGLDGLRLVPCELCWYQRILMYPLIAILAVAFVRRDARVAAIGAGFAGVGVLVAAYHSLIQYLPHLEPETCNVGSCTAILYKTFGLTIPNQSLFAFASIAALLGSYLYVEHALRPAPTAPAPPTEEE